MTTREQEVENMIQNMVAAGVKFSMHMRNPFTGEKELVCLSADRFSGSLKYIQMLDTLGLVGWSRCADLNHIYSGAQDQYKWDKTRWEKEIRARMP